MSQTIEDMKRGTKRKHTIGKALQKVWQKRWRDALSRSRLYLGELHWYTTCRIVQLPEGGLQVAARYVVRWSKAVKKRGKNRPVLNTSQLQDVANLVKEKYCNMDAAEMHCMNSDVPGPKGLFAKARKRALEFLIEDKTVMWVNAANEQKAAAPSTEDTEAMMMRFASEATQLPDTLRQKNLLASTMTARRAWMWRWRRRHGVGIGRFGRREPLAQHEVRGKVRRDKWHLFTL